MSASRNICENEIELLIQAMNERFQSDPSLNESDILKLKRNGDKIWEPVCKSVYGKYDYILALRLKKRWIDKKLSLDHVTEQPMDLSLMQMNEEKMDIDENDLLKENSNQFTDENIFSINFTKPQVDHLRRFIYYSPDSKKTLKIFLLKIKVWFI